MSAVVNSTPHMPYACVAHLQAAMAEASATLPTPEPLPSVVGGTPMASR